MRLAKPASLAGSLPESGWTGGRSANLGGKLDKRFGDEHGDRIEVARMRFKAEALCFEWDRAAAAEWVNDGRRPVWIAAPNLCSCLFEDLLVG